MVKKNRVRKPRIMTLEGAQELQNEVTDEVIYEAPKDVVVDLPMVALELPVSVNKLPDFVVTEVEKTEEGKIAIELTVDTPQEAIIKVCSCNKYEGDAFKCRVHEPINECPNQSCRCVHTDMLISSLESSNHYRCTLCGVFYIRDSVTGVYVYAR